MKQSVSLYLTLFLALAANAGTIRITAEDVGDSRLCIGYEVISGTELPVGFGIDISLSGPATFQNVISTSPYFPIYPGTIEIVGSEIIDFGTPIAPASYPSTLGGLGTSGVTIEMGIPGNPLAVMPPPFDRRDFNSDGVINHQDLAIFVNYWLEDISWPEFVPLLLADLNGDGVVNFMDYGIFVDGRYDAPPEVINKLMLLQLDGNGAATTTVTISKNLIRGGIVNDDGMPFDVILPEPFTMVVPEPGTVLLFGLGSLALLRKRRE